MSDPNDPDKKPPPQPTVAWNPADLPGLGGDASEADEDAEKKPAKPPAAPSGSQPTLAMDASEMLDAAAAQQAGAPPSGQPPQGGAPPSKPAPQATMAWNPEDLPAVLAPAEPVSAQ